MSRSTLRTSLLLGIAALAAFHASPALAEPKDDAALDLAKKAIYTDYLGTKFEDAEKKLLQAITLCGEADCSSKVKAQLHRDLGTVYFGGMNRQDEGKTEFGKALKEDPKIELDTELATPEMQVAWNEAKKGGSAAGNTGGAAGAGGAAPVPQGAAAGDMVHTPPAEQAILTPVPLYAELPQGTGAVKVVLNYKAFGVDEWKAVEMKRVGNGYGLEVPCAEIGSLTGSLKYFIQAFDAQSTPVSYSGTRNQPHSVAIVQERAGEAPHLPGQPPPSKCADAGDCPPEFPGCKALGADKDKDKPCEGENCPATPPADEAKKNWVSLAVQQDFLFLGGETNSCAGTGSYQCFRQGGGFYDLVPYDKSGGEIAGGINVATTRILAGYDRVVWRFKLGVRLGFAFGGGPQAPDGLAFLPIHAEARASYWFGSDPFGSAGPKFYLTAGGGLAQVDSKVTVVVYETRQDYLDDKRLKLDAWRKSGTGFLVAGAGFLYALSPRMGPFAEARVIQMLGASNTGLGLQLGYSFGF